MEVYRQLLYTVAEIQETRDILQQKDSTGENTAIATHLLVHTPLGDSLRNAIDQTIQLCEKALVDKKQLAVLDATFGQTLEMITPEGWPRYFKDTPTVGALTLLSYLNGRLTNAAALTLKDIDDHLK